MQRNPMFSLAGLCLLLALASAGLFAQVGFGFTGAPGGGGVPAQKIELVTYTGTITTVDKTVNSGASITFTLHTDAGDQLITTAPERAMTKLGLTLSEKQAATVTGMPSKIAQNGKIVPAVIAFKITISDKDYVLRDATTGAQAWSYYDVFCTQQELTGEITKVDVATPSWGRAGGSPYTASGAGAGAGIGVGAPAPSMPAGAPAVNAPIAIKFVTLTVKTDAATYTFSAGTSAYAEQIHFAPEVGAKITMKGWVPLKNTVPTPAVASTAVAQLVFVVQQIKIGDTVYPFRDANGKELWNMKK